MSSQSDIEGCDDVSEANRFSEGHFETLQCEKLHAFRPAQGEVIPFMTGAHVKPHTLEQCQSFSLIKNGGRMWAGNETTYVCTQD